MANTSNSVTQLIETQYHASLNRLHRIAMGSVITIASTIFFYLHVMQAGNWETLQNATLIAGLASSAMSIFVVSLAIYDTLEWRKLFKMVN